MNASAAHRNELERLLIDLSGDIAVSKTNFVALVDAYITRLNTNCIRHERPRQSAASANKRRINMEPTLTQNCALYYAQHKTSKRRAALFEKFRAAARKQGPDIRRQLTFGELFLAPRLHKDNGR
jgi:hypothetical protein